MSTEKEDIQILRKDIEIDNDDVLGRGGFGQVVAAYLSDGTKVAVKMLLDNGPIPERNQKELWREACRLKELSHHRSVINLHGILFERDSFGLVLEYMHFGSSSVFVKNYHKVELPLLLRMTCQVTSAMMYLHSYNPPILHLDLKADNVLIDRFFNAKVSDFGLSEWRTVSKMLTKGGSEMVRRCTITHIAPEILCNVNHPSTDKLDIYAFGITVWEFFAAKRPYENKSDNVVRQAVCNGQRPDMPSLSEDCPMIIKLMITKCWNSSPNKRPAFKDIFPEMEKTFDDHKGGITQALRSLRQKICEKHNVNDLEYMDTEYIDDFGSTETDSIPMETETSDDRKPVVMETETTEVNVEGDQPILKRSPALQYKPRLTELSEEEKQLRRILRDPVAFEIVQSESCDNIELSSNMREIVRDPSKLREYINNDPELRYELLRSGSPVLSKFRMPNVRNNTAKGKCEQRLANRLQKLDASYRVKKSKIDMDELDADEKRRVERARELQNCSYSQKLYNKGLGLNLLKVLREPHKLEKALTNYQANKGGSQPKFETIDRRIVEAAQDPFLLQILLTQDYSLLDGLMSQYPNLMMNLISANKTTYRPSQPSSSARNSSSRMPNQGARGMMDVNRQEQMGATVNDLSVNPTRPLQNNGMGNNTKMEGVEKESKTHEKKKRNDTERKLENERRIKEILEEAKRKSEEEKRKKEKEARKKFEQEQMKREEEIKAEEKRRRQEEERKKMEINKEIRPEQGHGGPSGYLGSLFGVFRGTHNASLFESTSHRIRMPEQPASLQSMDKLSMEVDELSNKAGPILGPTPARGHANPLAPRPEASPNKPAPRPEARPAPPSPTVKLEPNTSKPESRLGNSPQHSPTNSSSNTRQGNSNSTIGSDAPFTRQTPPTGGATGVGGARVQTGNITISHQHAGGGFSHITINQDAPNQPNIQVGNRNLMVIGGDSDSDREEKKVEDSKKKKRRYREIKLPDQRLDMDRLDIVCTGIGKHWKRLCRELNLDEAAIEQIEQDYHINGTYEIMYQALQRWIQKHGKAATIKALGQHLANIDRDDLMKKLK